MHSLNHAVLGISIADERAGRYAFRALQPPAPERPPSLPVRARVAFATGRLASRLDREMARRAVA
jgi:hypothetical protein